MEETLREEAQVWTPEEKLSKAADVMLKTEEFFSEFGPGEVFTAQK